MAKFLGKKRGLFWRALPFKASTSPMVLTAVALMVLEIPGVAQSRPKVSRSKPTPVQTVNDIIDDAAVKAYKNWSKAEARKIFPKYDDALNYAISLHDTHVGDVWPNRRWYDYLPPCPDSTKDVDSDEWDLDPKWVGKLYHDGASSYRSTRRYTTPYESDNRNPALRTWHGQQGCYRNGVLIVDPSNPGAGTPDFGGTGKPVLTYVQVKTTHWRIDVSPWEIPHYKVYNEYWPAQGGSTASFHVLVGRTEHGANAFNSPSPFVDGLHPKPGGQKLESAGWRDTMLDVKQGDVITLEARGEVVWGVLGEKCDADGDPNTKEKLMREMFAPRPFPDELIGTLMGAVVSNNNLPSPDEMPGFRVGKQLRYTVPTDGRLWLGINDSDTYNNKGYFDVQVHKLPARKKP